VFFVFALIIGAVAVIALNEKSTVLKNSDLESGVSAEVVRNAVKLEIDGKDSEVVLSKSTSSSATIVFDEKSLDFELGDSIMLDVDSDCFDDILIRLNSISDEIPSFYFELIEEVLKEEAEDESVDVVESVESAKVIEVVENETECVENWTCGEWGNCTDGVEVRKCTDSSNCGTILKRPKIAYGCEEDVEDEEEENSSEYDIILCDGFVNREEVGGENITAGTAYGLSEVDSKGFFESNFSGVGAQLSLVIEEEDLRATAITLASCEEDWIFDGESTAKAQVFMSFGIMTTNVSEARIALDKIGELESFSNFSSYLGNNLNNYSLNYLSELEEYNLYLGNCIFEMFCLIDDPLYPCEDFEEFYSDMFSS
jgi:hypothetical protein